MWVETVEVVHADWLKNTNYFIAYWLSQVQSTTDAWSVPLHVYILRLEET
jgi:hypothetical protein